MLGKIMAEQDIKIISHTHTHSGFKFKNCIEYNDIRYMAQSNNNSSIHLQPHTIVYTL